AAHLACGARLNAMGELLSISDLVELPISAPESQPGGGWTGAILHVDRFGNLITNFQVQPHQRGLQVGAGGRWIGQISRTFTDVDRGELLAYVGSSGYLEIAAREASAAEILSLGVGDTVQIEGAL
nr:hypothetical protein [Anaerolineae bacterium]